MNILTDPSELAAITKNMDRPTTIAQILGTGLKMKVEHLVTQVGGKDYPCVLTRLYGLAVYVDQGREIKATEATFSDYGPRQGVARGFTQAKEVEPTPEQRAAGRRHIIEVATKCLIDQGIW